MSHIRKLFFNDFVLLLAFALAITTRILFMFFFTDYSILVADEPEYFWPAASLSSGQGYQMVPQQSSDGTPHPTAYRMPIPAMLISVVLAMVGPSVLAARIACLILASLSVFATYGIAKQISNRSSARVASLITAVYPPWVFYSVTVLSEAFYIPLLGFVVLWSNAVLQSLRYSKWLLLGVGWGLLAMIRPHAIPCWRPKEERRSSDPTTHMLGMTRQALGCGNHQWGSRNIVSILSQSKAKQNETASKTKWLSFSFEKMPRKFRERCLAKSGAISLRSWDREFEIRLLFSALMSLWFSCWPWVLPAGYFIKHFYYGACLRSHSLLLSSRLFIGET